MFRCLIARRFVSGGSWLAGWKPDGTVLAAATYSGALGSAKPFGNVEFFDSDGARFGHDLTLAHDEHFNGFSWAGDRILLATRDG